MCSELDLRSINKLINFYTKLNIGEVINISFLCIIIPFLFTNYTLDPVLHPRFLAWSIFLLVSIIIILISNRSFSINDAIVIKKYHLLFVAFVVFSFISIIKAVNISEAIFDFLKNFCFLLSFLMFFNLFRKNDRFFEHVSVGMTISGLITGGIVFFMILKSLITDYDLQKTYEIFGFMGHKNQLSLALFLFIPFSVKLVFTRSIIAKVLGLVTTNLLLASIIILHTRSVVIGLTASLIFVFIISVVYLFKKKKFSLNPSILLLVVLIISILFSVEWFTPYNFSSVFIDRFKTSFDVHDNIRIKIWEESLGLFSGNVFLGVGGGNWKLTLPSVGTTSLPSSSFSSTFFQRPHNDPIWVLCENGLIGFLLFYGFIGFIFFSLLKTFFKKNEFSRRNNVLLMLFVLTGYFVASLFTFPKERIFHQVLLSFFLAYSCYITTGTGKFNSALKIAGKPIITVLTLVLLTVSVVFAGYRVQGEHYTKRALYYRDGKQWQQVIKEINKGYSPFYTVDQTAIPLKFYSGVAKYSLKDYSAAINDFIEAKEHSPYNVHVLNNLGSTYYNTKKYSEAIQSYKELLTYYPSFSEAAANLATAYIKNGEVEKALEVLKTRKLTAKRKNELINHLKTMGITL
jgi:O-antigen ligase